MYGTNLSWIYENYWYADKSKILLHVTIDHEVYSAVAIPSVLYRSIKFKLSDYINRPCAIYTTKQVGV